KRIQPRAKPGETPLRFSWNTPLLPSTHVPARLYCGTQFVMRSADRGDSWERISEDLTGGAGALLSLAESTLDAQRLVAGAGRSLVHVTKDGGEHWTSVGEDLPRAALRKVIPSVHAAERLYVCLSGAGSGDRRPLVYVSEDFGKSWRSLGAGLPAEPVNVLVEDPAREGLLYVGTELGVYASTDAGASWSSLSAGLPTAPVMDMAVHHTLPVLVVVTHGLSAFACELGALRAAQD
ncbi:MAG: photosystem II stability/assembly factor-like uncharacterized protein, partial [Planctomycetota bacterium]